MTALKTTVKRAFNSLGYRINRMPRNTSEAHEDVLPFATYAPWNTDPAFAETHAAISNFTIVDKYRCYELWQLTAQAAKLDRGAILEVGVWRGGTGALMAKQAADCGVTDSVFLCDTFTGVVKATENDQTYQGGEHADTSRDVVENLVRRMDLENIQILSGIFPDDTGHEVKDEVFRMCHIDVDVYQSAREVNEWVWGPSGPGGIVVYDDYGFQACDGITRYVEEQRAMPDRHVLHNLNGHAVVIKLATAADPRSSFNDNPACDADAFMDEEDSEAVAERLRQLGYI